MSNINYPEYIPCHLNSEIATYISSIDNDPESYALIKEMIENEDMSYLYKVLSKMKGEHYILSLEPVISFFITCINVKNESDIIKPISEKKYKKIIRTIMNRSSEIADCMLELESAGINNPAWLRSPFDLIYEMCDQLGDTEFNKSLVSCVLSTSKDIGMTSFMKKLGQLSSGALMHPATYITGNGGFSRKRIHDDFKEILFIKRVSWYVKFIFGVQSHVVVSAATNIVFKSNKWTGTKIRSLLHEAQKISARP